MSYIVEQAIIPVAGYGTRRLPITKAIEKCMLPVGDRPIIDYVVEDCIKAGIREITFVVGEQSQQLRTYYGENQALERYLLQRNQHEQLEQVKHLRTKATFRYVVQEETMPYGTAIPISLAVKQGSWGDHVLISMGDELVYNKDGSSEMQRLIHAVQNSDSTAGLLAARVPKERVSNYGVLKLSDSGHFAAIVDRPSTQAAPSNLINISRYLFDHTLLFDCIERVVHNPPAPNGEYQLTEALNMYVADGHPLEVVEAMGTYLDGGTTKNWLAANNYVHGNV